MVPLALTASPYVVHYGPWDASLGVIGIHLQFPETILQHAMQIALSSHCPDVTILARGCGVISHCAVLLLSTIAELILTAGCQHLSRQRRAHLCAEPLLPQCREAEHIGRPVFCLEFQVVGLALVETGSTRTDIYSTRMTKVAGRLQQCTLLSVEQRNLFDVVQRELAQVNLSVLGITQLYAIVRDAQMVGTHRTDVHRLDAPHSTIVLQLQTREVAQRVSHIVGTQLLQLLTRQCLRGYHLLMVIARRDNDLIHMLNAVEATALWLLCPQAHRRHQYDYCHFCPHHSIKKRESQCLTT